MDNEYFDKFIEERYEDQIDWYDKKSTWNQKRYKFWQGIIIIASTITPILIALEIEKWPIITISAIVAIGTTILKTFKYQENWINYRTTCETLRKEIYFYSSLVGDYKSAEEPESLFVERVESLISRENTMWLSTHRPKKEK